VQAQQILFVAGKAYAPHWRYHRQAAEYPGTTKKDEMPELEPEIADEAPVSDELTAYDETHLVTYLRILDAETDGADWREVARIVLRLDPAVDPDGARRCWESHLNRAKWMTKEGYRYLVAGARAR